VSKPDIWMPLYIADYLADTTRLTTEQHGAYLLLIMDYWRNGPLPDDDAALANIARLSLSQWKKQRGTIARMFQLEEGSWRHKRIDVEMAEAAANAKRNSERARKAAEKRWGRDGSSDAPSTARAEHDECPSPSPATHPAGEGAFAMFVSWQPSAHVAEMARQANASIPPEVQQEFIAYWLAQRTQRTQAEWDRALLQSTMFHKGRAARGKTTTTRGDIHDQRANTIAQLTGRTRAAREPVTVAAE
jgi:uncharacterized protein YdaU (DUF1376 family)